MDYRFLGIALNTAIASALVNEVSRTRGQNFGTPAIHMYMVTQFQIWNAIYDTRRP